MWHIDPVALFNMAFCGPFGFFIGLTLGLMGGFIGGKVWSTY